MSYILSHEEISIIKKTLSSKQSEFLARNIRNNVYDIMLGKLVNSGKIRRMKNVDDEDLYYLANAYELVERRVAEDGQRFTCDEGHMNLKYLYIVRNVEDGKIIKLGGTCLKNLTGLSGDVVNALIKCFNGIDREYERILLALREGEWENQKEYLNIEDIPATMKRQLGLGLPLSELQLSKIERQIRHYFTEKELKVQEFMKQLALEKQITKVLEEMNENQKDYYKQCTEDDKDFIVRNYYALTTKHDGIDIDNLDLMPDVVDRVKLGLPLSFVQESILSGALKEAERQKSRTKFLVEQKIRQSMQEHYSYDEIIEKFDGILGELKANKEAVKGKCPNTYGRVVLMIKDARDGKKVKRRDLVLELQGLSNAMGWGYDLY